MPTQDPRPNWSSVRAVDSRTAGEPFQIVTNALVALLQTDVLDRRSRAMADSPGQTLRHRSVIASRFNSTVRDIVDGLSSPQVVGDVAGTAHRNWVLEFVLDRPYYVHPGFVLR